MTSRAPTPLQDRSTATCDRIVEATRNLLQTTRFDDLSVRVIVRRAGASIGSFYNLFADKEALLEELYRRHGQEMVAQLDAFCRRQSRARLPLRKLVETLVQELVALHRRQSGLLRTLVLRGHSDPRRSRRRPSAMDDILPALARLLTAAAPAIRHPQPRAAAGLSVLLAIAVLREAILFPGTSAHVFGFDDATLQRELARLILRYLEVR